MDDYAHSNKSIVATYTIHPANKEKLIKELKRELFDIDHQNTYLKDEIVRELEKNPNSSLIGKSLQIEVNTLRIDEINQMLERMKPKRKE